MAKITETRLTARVPCFEEVIWDPHKRLLTSLSLAATGSQPFGSSFLNASVFWFWVRRLINTGSVGSERVEQMAQASLGEMKNANLWNVAKTTWLEISLGGGLNSSLKATSHPSTHLSSLVRLSPLFLFLSLSPSLPFSLHHAQHTLWLTVRVEIDRLWCAGGYLSIHSDFSISPRFISQLNIKKIYIISNQQQEWLITW